MQTVKKAISISRLLAGSVFALAVAACVYSPQGDGYVPPPDPRELLSESSVALREVRSMKFHLTHQRGSIYYLDDAGSHIKATEITGEWSADAGLNLMIDAYLVRSRHVEPTSGTFFPLQMILVSDGLYITDPLSGQWVLQSPQLAIIPVGALSNVMANLVSQIEAPNLDDDEEIDGREAYKISGRISASAANWLSMDLGDNAEAEIILWIDREDHLPRMAHLIGAVGRYDDPGTMRQMRFSDFNQPVQVNPPRDFVDVR